MHCCVIFQTELPLIELKNISKKFRNFSLKSINLQVEQGSYFVLLGNSGSGKSVLLETIAGFYSPDSGQIFINKKDVTNLSIAKRKTALVFHDSALFPHLTVRGNLMYSLKTGKIQRSKWDSLVNDMASLTEVSQLLDRYPAKLSGGEKQRVALGRALLQKPHVLMLDEPLASMDVTLRSNMRSLLRKINRSGQTIIHVTHDFEEAAMLATEIAVIENGSIMQCGKPAHVFQSPKSEFIARFSGYKNFFEGNIVNNNGHSVFRTKNIEIVLSDSEAVGYGFAAIRSEDVSIGIEKPISSARNNYRGQVTSIEQYHSNYEIIVDAGQEFSAYITAEAMKELALDVGSWVWVSFKAFSVKFIEK